MWVILLVEGGRLYYKKDLIIRSIFYRKFRGVIVSNYRVVKGSLLECYYCFYVIIFYDWNINKEMLILCNKRV